MVDRNGTCSLSCAWGLSTVIQLESNIMFTAPTIFSGSGNRTLSGNGTVSCDSQRNITFAGSSDSSLLIEGISFTGCHLTIVGFGFFSLSYDL